MRDASSASCCKAHTVDFFPYLNTQYGWRVPSVLQQLLPVTVSQKCNADHLHSTVNQFWRMSYSVNLRRQYQLFRWIPAAVKTEGCKAITSCHNKLLTGASVANEFRHLTPHGLKKKRKKNIFSLHHSHACVLLLLLVQQNHGVSLNCHNRVSKSRVNSSEQRKHACLLCCCDANIGCLSFLCQQHIRYTKRCASWCLPNAHTLKPRAR